MGEWNGRTLAPHIEKQTPAGNAQMRSSKRVSVFLCEEPGFWVLEREGNCKSGKEPFFTNAQNKNW